jgi:hypothetical protein
MGIIVFLKRKGGHRNPNWRTLNLIEKLSRYCKSCRLGAKEISPNST